MLSLFQLLSDFVSSGNVLDRLATPTLTVLKTADSNDDQEK